MSKRDTVDYVVGFGLMALAVFLDIYFATNNIELAASFNGAWNDWLGIILLNVGLGGMGYGMIGGWETFSMSAKSLGQAWVVALAASVLLILL